MVAEDAVEPAQDAAPGPKPAGAERCEVVGGAALQLFAPGEAEPARAASGSRAAQ